MISLVPRTFWGSASRLSHGLGKVEQRAFPRREREREYDNQKNTIVVADSYQAHVGILATILEYIAIRHRYSDKEMSLLRR